MASVIMRRLKNTRTRNRLYSAKFSREGQGLPKKRQLTAQQVSKPGKGTRGFVPKGTDTKTPGYTGSGKR